MMRIIVFIFVCISFIQIHTSSHNHNLKHSQQMERMWRLGLLFDHEVKKAEEGLELEIFHHRIGAPSIFSQSLAIKTRRDLPPDFRGILKAMNRLTDSMVCADCQGTYRSITRHNIQKVETIRRKLETGELSKKEDRERGHYS